MTHIDPTDPRTWPSAEFARRWASHWQACAEASFLRMQNWRTLMDTAPSRADFIHAREKTILYQYHAYHDARRARQHMGLE